MIKYVRETKNFRMVDTIIYDKKTGEKANIYLDENKKNNFMDVFLHNFKIAVILKKIVTEIKAEKIK